MKKSILLFVYLCLFCSCITEKTEIDTQNRGKQITAEKLQGYWKGDRLGFPVNIDENFQITETGLPAPAGLRHSLQYYFSVNGNDVDCYVKCIFNANVPEATENPVYTILHNRNYSISIENGYKVNTDFFENMSSYDVASEADVSSIVLLREDKGTIGYTHISFTLNTVSESEWNTMVSGATSPDDSGYDEIYEKVFNNF